MITVVSQDRDLIVAINEVELNTEVKYYEGTFMGVNVRHEQLVLGTYDDFKEALLEISNIITCKQAIYVMGGFENYD